MMPNDVELEPEILPPIYQSAQVPLNNIEAQNMNLNEYNEMNNPNEIKSYSYPEQNNINNNQQFAKVLPMTTNINNNVSYANNNNQYMNEINPQYGQNENNIIYSTPIQIKPNVIN